MPPRPTPPHPVHFAPPVPRTTAIDDHFSIKAFREIERDFSLVAVGNWKRLKYFKQAAA